MNQEIATNLVRRRAWPAGVRSRQPQRLDAARPLPVRGGALAQDWAEPGGLADHPFFLEGAVHHRRHPLRREGDCWCLLARRSLRVMRLRLPGVEPAGVGGREDRGSSAAKSVASLSIEDIRRGARRGGRTSGRAKTWSVCVINAASYRTWRSL